VCECLRVCVRACVCIFVRASARACPSTAGRRACLSATIGKRPLPEPPTTPSRALGQAAQLSVQLASVLLLMCSCFVDDETGCCCCCCCSSSSSDPDHVAVGTAGGERWWRPREHRCNGVLLASCASDIATAIAMVTRHYAANSTENLLIIQARHHGHNNGCEHVSNSSRGLAALTCLFASLVRTYTPALSSAASSPTA
jgi:hypothetical protein